MLDKEGTDPAYEALRKPPNEYCADRRDAFLQLWQRTAPYLDRHLADRARRDLHAVYWEMHVAAALIDAGAVLVPRERRTPRKEGPDLLSENPRTWIEAVIATAGRGDDAVPTAPLGQASSVPDDQMVLRLTQAITYKRDRREEHVRRGWVAASDAYLIAVNAGALPSGMLELTLPRIVRAVFPFGHMAISMNTKTGEISDSFYQHRSSITKTVGTPISTTLFEDPSYAGISGCLYSTADAFNPGRSLSFVSNPLSTAPLDRGCLRGVTEYWREGDELHVNEPAA